VDARGPAEEVDAVHGGHTPHLGREYRGRKEPAWTRAVRQKRLRPSTADTRHISGEVIEGERARVDARGPAEEVDETKLKAIFALPTGGSAVYFQ
jgi:hypothetical protein